MKKLLVAAIASTAGIVPAVANEPARLSYQASICWSVPAGAGGFTAEFDVTLIDRGEVGRIDLIRYGPETPLARELASSAASAIQRCEPYNQAGTFRFVMDSRQAQAQ